MHLQRYTDILTVWFYTRIYMQTRFGNPQPFDHNSVNQVVRGTFYLCLASHSHRVLAKLNVCFNLNFTDRLRNN